MKQEEDIFYRIKELEKVILQNLASPIMDEECKSPMLSKATPTQMRIVGYILNNIDKGNIYQKDIEEALNLSKATVSDVINRMEKNDLIERKTNPEDTRSKRIELKGKAKSFFEGNKIKLKELEKRASRNISLEELNNFSNVLNKMIENLKEE